MRRLWARKAPGFRFVFLFSFLPLFCWSRRPLLFIFLSLGPNGFFFGLGDQHEKKQPTKGGTISEKRKENN
ncbi:hypothetical protein DFJ73DRAFT_809690 [Zopfochytrium polystomum]|nr:hypothetical protein DFJ73DRAFT_809690 [Zopfochytrium polystomum]